MALEDITKYAAPEKRAEMLALAIKEILETRKEYSNIEVIPTYFDAGCERIPNGYQITDRTSLPAKIRILGSGLVWCTFDLPPENVNPKNIPIDIFALRLEYRVKMAIKQAIRDIPKRFLGDVVTRLYDFFEEKFLERARYPWLNSSL